MSDYTISTELDVNDEGSDFATVTITFANGETIVERFARWFDSGPIESAAVQAASYIAAFEDTQNYTLEELLGPYGIEWEREQYERQGW